MTKKKSEKKKIEQCSPAKVWSNFNTCEREGLLVGAYKKFGT